ncbi:MAG: helix-turn-helix transcriptional regulator [Eubacteriales bacterium]|nr:helix-turn-helix transcriptional regulator [Eubacteriales bacterium]
MQVEILFQPIFTKGLFVDYIPWTVNPEALNVAFMEKRMAQVCRVLGNNVKALRLAQGLSQEALALEAELDRTYISQIERGVGNPSVLVLLKIAVILKVDVSDLFIKQK